MRDGRIEQVGAAAEVYERPATRFVAEFVGTSNVLDAAAARRIAGVDRTVSVRPEKIRVHERGAAPPAEADEVRVDGVVREVVYSGAATRVVADVGDGVVLAALVLNAETAGRRFDRGRPVTLGWPAAATRPVEPTPEEESS
jgi:putative spermidine/putrescine transport system ATP-binding protein